MRFTKIKYVQTERSTNFLDLKSTITDEGIVTDLYRKETDRVQYLLPSSCHPNHISTNVPYSLALRLVRICSRREYLLKRFKELSKMLTSRGYNKNVIKSAIERASKIEYDFLSTHVTFVNKKY